MLEYKDGLNSAHIADYKLGIQPKILIAKEVAERFAKIFTGYTHHYYLPDYNVMFSDVTMTSEKAKCLPCGTIFMPNTQEVCSFLEKHHNMTASVYKTNIKWHVHFTHGEEIHTLPDFEDEIKAVMSLIQCMLITISNAMGGIRTREHSHLVAVD